MEPINEDGKEQGPSPKELYDQKKKEKEESKKAGQRKEKIAEAPKKAGKWALYIFVIAVVVGGIGWFIARIPNLPPTSMENHIESSPPAHIVNQPIPENIQRHMLEHADGGGSPGILIQYNCKDYECAPDLIEKLTALVNEYPENVYLAPNKYDGKIILTKLGKREILETLDEETIRTFIGGQIIKPPEVSEIIEPPESIQTPELEEENKPAPK